MDAEELIKHFKLEKHPEGGYFREIYRSDGIIPSENLCNKFIGDRNFATSIYFLLTSDSFSAFHKINQDEIWHFYSGSTLKIHLISPEGEYSFVLIGNDFKNGEVPQFTVPAQHYFAAEVLIEDSFAFVGCSVSPGFDFRDFTLPSYKKLVAEFPKHEIIIKRLTHH